MNIKNKKTGDSKNGNPNITLGKWGENVAAQFLSEHGCQIIEKNVRTPDGEIDIVVKNGNELIFVEVKTRRNILHSYPEEAVNDEKLEHIEAAAGWYLLKHPEFDDNWRLDVVTVIGSPSSGITRVDWFENVTG